MTRHIVTVSNIKAFHDRYTTEPNSGCWLWIGSTDTHGYGQIRTEERLWSAHRFSYYIHNCDYDSSLWVLHSCDIPCCVNPNHLRQGTIKDNMEDLVKRKRGRVMKPKFQGERHTNSKLSEEDVIEIHAKYTPWKYTMSMLSKEYNVSVSCIKQVLNGRLWGYIWRAI